MDPFTAALLSGGIGAIGSLFGSRQSSNAIEDASAAQAAATQQQLDFLREGYADAQQYMQPYQMGGANAYNQLLMQLGMGAPMGMPQQQPRAVPTGAEYGYGGGQGYPIDNRMLQDLRQPINTYPMSNYFSEVIEPKPDALPVEQEWR